MITSVKILISMKKIPNGRSLKLSPFVDKVITDIDKEEINLLDVGGGKGIILNQIAAHIENKHHIKVNKFALDLSPEMLKIQQESNPDLKKNLERRYQ